MEPLTKVFGRRLRAIRKSRGLTQQQLGRAAKLDFKHLGGIERGEHAASFDAVERLARALRVSYAEFFTPDVSTIGQLHEKLASMGDAGDFDREAARQFLGDLLAAVRRLETRRTR